MTSEVRGSLHCPLRAFHGCRDGVEGSKGFSCLVSHLKRQHFSTDASKKAVRDIIGRDIDVFCGV